MEFLVGKVLKSTLFISIILLANSVGLSQENTAFTTVQGNLENKRLELEIKEREWNLSWWGTAVKLAPFITLLPLGIWYGIQWTFQRKQQKLQAITNHKREFTSKNPAIRIGATIALTEYPRQAIPLYIASLKKEKDKEVLEAVKDSLKQIGKRAIGPLLDELKEIQKILKEELNKAERGERGNIWRGYSSDLIDFSIALYGSSDLIRKALDRWTAIAKETTKIEKEEMIGLEEEIVERIQNVQSSMSRFIIVHKDIVEVLTDLLRHHHVKKLRLSSLELGGVDLSGADLRGTDLTYTNLFRANLTDSNLGGANLRHAKLEGAFLAFANLSNANLESTALQDAELVGACLSGANLASADLSNAIFTFWLLLFGIPKESEMVKEKLTNKLRKKFFDKKEVNFKKIKNFTNANFEGVKGLSKEDLEYAKSKGAIIE